VRRCAVRRRVRLALGWTCGSQHRGEARWRRSLRGRPCNLPVQVHKVSDPTIAFMRRSSQYGCSAPPLTNVGTRSEPAVSPWRTSHLFGDDSSNTLCTWTGKLHGDLSDFARQRACLDLSPHVTQRGADPSRTAPPTRLSADNIRSGFQPNYRNPPPAAGPTVAVGRRVRRRGARETARGKSKVTRSAPWRARRRDSPRGPNHYNDPTM